MEYTATWLGQDWWKWKRVKKNLSGTELEKKSCRFSIAFLVGRIVFEHFMIKSWCWTYIQLTFLSDDFKTISRLFSSINTRPLDFVSYWAQTKILNIEMMLRNSLWLWMKVLFNPRKTPLMPINIKPLSKDEIVIAYKHILLAPNKTNFTQHYPSVRFASEMLKVYL